MNLKFITLNSFYIDVKQLVYNSFKNVFLNSDSV